MQSLRDFVYHVTEAGLLYQQFTEEMDTTKRAAAAQVKATPGGVMSTPAVVRSLSRKEFDGHVAELLTTLGLGEVMTNAAHTRHAARLDVGHRGTISPETFVELWSGKFERFIDEPTIPAA